MDIFELRQELIEHRAYIKDRVSRMDSREEVYEFIIETHTEYMTKQEGHEQEYQTAKILTDNKSLFDVKVELNNGIKSAEFKYEDAILNFATPSTKLGSALEEYRQGTIEGIESYIKLIDLALKSKEYEVLKKAIHVILKSRYAYELPKVLFKVDKSVKVESYKDIKNVKDNREQLELDIEDDEECIWTGLHYEKWSKLIDDLDDDATLTYNTNTILSELQEAQINKSTYYDFFDANPNEDKKEKSKYRNIDFERKFYINLALYLCMNFKQTEKFLQLNGFNLKSSLLPNDKLLLALIKLNLDHETIDMVMDKMEYKGLKLGDSRRKASNKVIDEYRIRKVKIDKGKEAPLSASEELKYQTVIQQEINKIDRFLERRENQILKEKAKGNKARSEKITELEHFKEYLFRSNDEEEVWSLEELQTERNQLISYLKALSGYYGNHDIDNSSQYDVIDIKSFDNSFDNIIKRTSKAMANYNQNLSKIPALEAEKKAFEKELSELEEKLNLVLAAKEDEKLKGKTDENELARKAVGGKPPEGEYKRRIINIKKRINNKILQISKIENAVFNKKFYTFEVIEDEFISFDELETLHHQLIYGKGLL